MYKAHLGHVKGIRTPYTKKKKTYIITHVPAGGKR